MIDRLEMAASLGYFDARTAIEFYQTHGLSLIDMTRSVHSKNLQMDWLGCEVELQLQCGMSKDKAISVISEAKHFAKFLPAITHSSDVIDARDAMKALLFGPSTKPPSSNLCVTP